MVGGICMLSAIDLKLVSSIHTKGKIISTAPAARTRYTRAVAIFLFLLKESINPSPSYTS